ncbi:MAG TPA: PEGA domain-containing protein, partial [Myxococcota bacterium]|nr:PEGA domain-containing protein [Myxococcota bacterium]
ALKLPPSGETPTTAPIIILTPTEPTPKSEGTRTPAGPAVTADQPTGTVTVRTVPSGATVQLAGKTLKPGPNGGYVLPAGSHSLTLISPSGEKEPRAVFVRAGESVTLCYNFDTNSSCSGSP